MKKFIKNKLVDMHRTCTTDKYGQIGKHNFEINCLFGDKAERAVAYAKKHGIFSVSTYGGTYGTFKAITDIKDPEIKEACKMALKTNENYLRNLNSW